MEGGGPAELQEQVQALVEQVSKCMQTFKQIVAVGAGCCQHAFLNVIMGSSDCQCAKPNSHPVSADVNLSVVTDCAVAQSRGTLCACGD